ncbi:unnamed protein product [Closterium sp. Yama58-4]|nr:unnamed protein product [Closterium sp. Yama58-4]
MHGRFAEAAALCPSALGNSETAWQWWIGNFSRLQQLHTLLPYVPVSNPKLSPATYEGVLVELLVSPHSSYHRQLPPTLARWPPALYNLGAIIAAAEERLLQHGTAIQLQLLAGLYVRNRDFIEALDVYLRILVAQHRANHTVLNDATQLTDSHERMDEHARAPAAAEMDGGFQGRVTSHADVDGEQLHSPVKLPVNGKVAGKGAAGMETAHKGNINRRAAGPSSEDQRRYPAQESTNVSSPSESLASAKWPGPDVFEFIREHRLVRHLLSPAATHHHRLPSLFLIHPRRAAALLADHIAVAPPEIVVRQLLGVDSPGFLGPPEPATVRQLSPHGSATLVDGAVNGVGDGEGSEAVELYADFDRRLLLPFLQSSDHYPLQDALNLCVQRGLVEEQVFLLTRMGDYKEALSLLLDRLKDVNRFLPLLHQFQPRSNHSPLSPLQAHLIQFLIHVALAFQVAALMEQASDIFSPKQLLAGVAPNTYLKELRQHLLAVLAASATEVSLRQGCIALMQSECIDLLCLFILQSQFAARFSSSAAPIHFPLLPLPSSTATSTSTLLPSPQATSAYTSSQSTSGFFPGGAAGTSLLSLYSRKPFRRKAFMGRFSGTAMFPDTPMDLFRSEEMQLVQLIIPAEAAHNTVAHLGELGLLQFKDLNPDKSPFQRTYANQVKRCGEMARKLRYFKDQSVKAGILPSSPAPLDKDFDLDDLEVKLAELEAELLEINANAEKLLRSRNELNELQLVLEKMDAAVHQREFEEASSGREITSDTALLLEQEMVSEPGKQMRLGFVTGLVPKVKAATFERILFRATRGNMYLKQEELDEPVVDPATGEEVEKVVFVVFFAGERARTKIMKICEAFGANRYPFPEDPQKQRQMHSEVIARLSELQTTIDAGNRHRDSLLNNISYQIENWASLVRREKAIYHILNQLSIDVTRKCLLAEAWCPVYAKSEIQDALHRAVTMSKADVGTIFQTIRHGESPPTYFKTNKFTGAFQGIIDAYGMARYREANPGVFTIITFPFLFAIMFGDWGHGILMLLASLWLVKNERKLGSQKLGDIMEMVYGGRYLILLMSIFSIYTGFVYNEFFAVAFDFAIFGGSAYTCRTPDCGDAASAGLVKTGNTYLFGVDPRWKGSRTELPFLNSLKMKMSIVLGVTHMFLGLALSLCNALFFDLPLNIWYEFIPQVLFLASLFGYLSLLIIVKWITASQADLYHVMIYMFLNPTEPLGENELFWGQGTLQIVLLLIALISVPWMLFPKPLILRAEHMKKRQGRAYAALNSDNELYEMEALHPGEEGQLHHHQHEEEFEFGEVMVHQMIHTIEFVLGAVSNTASYLRLWALSLAHAELSAVFFERVLLPAFESGNTIFIIIGFFVFASATVGVLLLMETLSAFLHALRLHWVEFMNKFYTGDGYKFLPFSFDTIADDEE